MKLVATLLTTFLLTIFAVSLGHSQERREQAVNSWTWIVPLKTTKINIEKRFGSSIDEDKTHPFQTYESDFGKITVVYAPEKSAASCFVEKGTVLNYSVSPRKLNLPDLGYDLSVFKRDATYSPRELSYFSEDLAILIGTKIVELPDKTKVERVIMILYHSPDAGKCKESVTTSPLVSPSEDYAFVRRLS